MMRLLALSFCALALGAAAPAGPAHAAAADAFTAAWQAQISAREARNIAERAYPRASVIHVRFVDGGRPFYAVRMIEDGRRFDVRVDARTGRIL